MDGVFELKKEDWNEIKKEPEVDYDAEDCDLVFEIFGVLFLLQRTNDMNNVICFRRESSNVSFLKVLRVLQLYLKSKKIQYLRVEGNLHRYFFLAKIKDAGEGFYVLKDDSIKNRNVFYVKLY